MQTFRVLAALLAYPEPDLIEALDEAVEIIVGEGLIPSPEMTGLIGLIEHLRDDDLLNAQERHVALFERRRSVSLHLYEHVHGESRDRGQAMVRLVQLYRIHGLEIAAHELPDYLPLYLEFLSVLPPAAARRFLGEALPIVAAIGSRLCEWASPYAAVFDALVAIAGPPPQDPVALPIDENDPAALDRAWEEQEVSFIGAAPAEPEAFSPFRAAPAPPRR